MSEKTVMGSDWWITRRINSTVAFTIIIVLSTLVAWYSIRTANEIVRIAPEMPEFNVQKRGVYKSNKNQNAVDTAEGMSWK